MHSIDIVINIIIILISFTTFKHINIHMNTVRMFALDVYKYNAGDDDELLVTS